MVVGNGHDFYEQTISRFLFCAYYQTLIHLIYTDYLFFFFVFIIILYDVYGCSVYFVRNDKTNVFITSRIRSGNGSDEDICLLIS